MWFRSTHIDLKQTCPRCNGIGAIDKRPNGYWIVGCSICNFQTAEYLAWEDAIKEWYTDKVIDYECD